MSRTGVAWLALCAASLTASQAAQVRVSIATDAFVRGGTAVLSVIVDIPPGHFIPAETRGALRGIALLPDRTTGTSSRSLGTLPGAETVRLPGADAPVLAYSGRTTIQLPIDIFPITLTATRISRFPVTQDVSVVLSYQLCDARACEPLTSQTAGGRIVSMPRAPMPESIAFRLDASRAAVLLDQAIPDQNGLEEESTHLGFVMPLRRLPPEHAALSKFTGDLANGKSWTIASARSDFLGTVERPTAFNGDCGMSMPLGVVLKVADAAFAGERMKYYLAKPGSAPQNFARGHPVVANVRLTDAQQKLLEDVIDKQMRMTLPSALAPDPEISNPSQQPKEFPYHARIRNGEGQLVYHLEAFRVAPDNDPRLFVRAYWALHGVARTGLTLWIRFDGSHFVVEHTDAHLSRYFGLDTELFGAAPAARPEYGGMLLNVIPAADGWAYILMGDAAYESAGITVWKYSPFGPMSTGLEYGHGC